MDGAPWGGSEELWSKTALRLRELGHPVGVSVLDWPRRPERIAELDRAGVKVGVRPLELGIGKRLIRRCLRPIVGRQSRLPGVSWLKNFAPDLVVISQGGPWDGVPWMLACHRLGLRYCCIVHAHSEIWWPPDSELENIRAALQNASRVFFVSRANRDLMERQCGMRLAQAAIVANPFNVVGRGIVPWPQNWGTTNIACVGRLEPRAKGQDLLLQVLSREKWRERPLHLNLYGTGPGEQSLRALAALLKLKSVTFHGHVSEVDGIWRLNEALVLTSRYEGLPLVIVEAMLCGRPVITTDVAGNTELVHEPVTGFVAEAPAVRLGAAAMERALSARDRWQAMGAKAREEAVRVTPADAVGDFVTTLMEIAASRSVPR